MARHTFFSFHYVPDVWRAWNVRNSWVVTGVNDDVGFFDKSVFESAKKNSADNLKAFLRDGLKNTSVTCVLNGLETHKRRWVRYEIVRSIVKGNGVLTVDINGIKDQSQSVTSRGPDPLDYVGLYKTGNGIYFAEINEVGQWILYEDYKSAIAEKDLWFTAPKSSVPVPLSKHCLRYDFALQNGRTNIGGWIETAAAWAGR